MKWLKVILSFLPLVLFILYLNIWPKITSGTSLNPETDNNLRLNQFRQVLNLSGLAFTIKSVDLYRQDLEVDFPNTVAHFSLDADPVSQVADLQNLLNSANIESKQLTFIDLTTIHPYATLTNR